MKKAILNLYYCVLYPLVLAILAITLQGGVITMGVALVSAVSVTVLPLVVLGAIGYIQLQL